MVMALLFCNSVITLISLIYPSCQGKKKSDLKVVRIEHLLSFALFYVNRHLVSPIKFFRRKPFFQGDFLQ